MRTNGKGNNPNAPSLFESQREVINADFTPITICCHVDYYMIKSCQDGFKVNYYIHEYVNFSVFSFFKFDVKKFSQVLIIFQWY